MRRLNTAKRNAGLGAVTLTALTLCLASGPLAAAGEKEQKPGQQMSKQSQASSQQYPGNMHRASQLIGKEVKNAQDKDLGEVEELVLDQYGRVQYVILSHGGVLDIGDKLVAVPWHAFQTPEGAEEDYLQLNVSQEQLAEAPNFGEKEYSRLNDPEWIVRIDTYYLVPQQGGEQTASRISTRRTFVNLDLDNDGKISRQELQQVSRLNQQFDQADQNSDGQISQSEFSAFEQQQGPSSQQPQRSRQQEQRGQSPSRQQQSGEEESMME